MPSNRNNPREASEHSDDLTHAELRDALLGGVPTEELHALGVGFQTATILDAYADFVRSAQGIWGHLTPTQRAHFIGFDLMVLDLIAPEADLLREKLAHTETAASAEGIGLNAALAQEKALRADGVALRDQCVRLLRRMHTGDAGALAQIDIAVGTAETTDDLARALDDVAKLVADAHAGAKGPRRAVLQRLGIHPAHATKLRELEGAAFYGNEVQNPQVGDLRISYQMVRPQPVSVVAKQSGGTFVAYEPTPGVEPVFLVQAGEVESKAMFATAKDDTPMSSWLFRGLGVVLGAVAFALMLLPFSERRPLVPGFAKAPRVSGVLVGTGLGFALYAATMGGTWVTMRPAFAVPLFVVSLVAVVLSVMAIVRARKA